VLHVTTLAVAYCSLFQCFVTQCVPQPLAKLTAQVAHRHTKTKQGPVNKSIMSGTTRFGLFLGLGQYLLGGQRANDDTVIRVLLFTTFVCVRRCNSKESSILVEGQSSHTSQVEVPTVGQNTSQEPCTHPPTLPPGGKARNNAELLLAYTIPRRDSTVTAAGSKSAMAANPHMHERQATLSHINPAKHLHWVKSQGIHWIHLLQPRALVFLAVASECVTAAPNHKCM